MNAKEKKLEAALQAWVDAKNAEATEPRWRDLADVTVREENGRLNMFYDGAGYDLLSYQADYGGLYRKEVETIATKHGFHFEDNNTWSMAFYQD
jgi:hypothetical protein